MPQERSERLNDLGQLKRLGKDACGTESQQLVLSIVAGLSGHETARELGIESAKGKQRLGTIQARHTDVQQDQVDVGALLLVDVKGLLAVGRLPHRESVSA